MERLKILQVIITVWLLLFVTVVVYIFINPPPTVCYESQAYIDPITKELRPSGGCSSKYGQALIEIGLIFIPWIVILSIFLIFYSRSRKKIKL